METWHPEGRYPAGWASIMANRNTALPYFPLPPAEYNQDFMSQIVRSFALYIQAMQNPGEGRNTFTVFTNLQTDDYGLETGATFQVDGTLKIVLLNKPHPRGVSATAYVGSVTVSTP